jgi:hypothetical protein
MVVGKCIIFIFQGSSMLLELLSTLFDQFRAIARAHSFTIQSLRRAAEKYKVDCRLYEMTEVWSNIQVVVSLQFTLYAVLYVY